MQKAEIRWNNSKNRYDLVAAGKVLVSSKKSGYLTYLVTQQKHSAILAAKVTSAVIVSEAPIAPMTATSPTNIPVAPVQEYSVNERFDFTRQLAKMVIEKKARSLIVGGEGGIGKTYTIKEAFDELGKVDVATLLPSIEDLNPIEVDDSEPEIEEKVFAEMNAFKGDYVVVKGHASAKALYRLLWENRNRTILFDDCDKVLQDQTAVMLLKPALDSYEDRWVSWRVEGFAKDSDLPATFKFNGSIIFITNMPMAKIDEAVKTRCYKVDVSMTFPQRIERMEAVLDRVMPEISLDKKTDALNLLKENLHRVKDVNFRSLMNLITIRDTVADWKPLATFALLEH
jgi:Cdc6-like AAA superfamily ATPase